MLNGAPLARLLTNVILHPTADNIVKFKTISRLMQQFIQRYLDDKMINNEAWH